MKSIMGMEKLIYFTKKWANLSFINLHFAPHPGPLSSTKKLGKLDLLSRTPSSDRDEEKWKKAPGVDRWVLPNARAVVEFQDKSMKKTSVQCHLAIVWLNYLGNHRRCNGLVPLLLTKLKISYSSEKLRALAVFKKPRLKGFTARLKIENWRWDWKQRATSSFQWTRSWNNPQRLVKHLASSYFNFLSFYKQNWVSLVSN